MTMGKHFILNLYECDPDLLNNPEYICKALESAAARAGATVLKTIYHQFEPQGVTAISMLSESHISIHTWPEKGTAACDIYTCGDCDPRSGGFYIKDSLLAKDCTVVYIDRE